MKSEKRQRREKASCNQQITAIMLNDSPLRISWSIPWAQSRHSYEESHQQKFYLIYCYHSWILSAILPLAVSFQVASPWVYMALDQYFGHLTYEVCWPALFPHSWDLWIWQIQILETGWLFCLSLLHSLQPLHTGRSSYEEFLLKKSVYETEPDINFTRLCSQLWDKR